MRVLLIGVLAGFVLSACSGVHRAEESKAATSPMPEVTEAQVLKEYTLAQFNEAATYLRASFDQHLEGKSEPIAGCQVSQEQAQSSLQALKALIDQKVIEERKEYLQSRDLYRKKRDLQHCDKTCACGVYFDVLDPVKNQEIKWAKFIREHNRLKEQLERKAGKQTPAKTLECAQKQNWYCTSSLKAFVEKADVANP